MSKYIPSIDNSDTRADGTSFGYMCTHSHIDSDIYLYRHVGDCLISEYWFKQKFYPSDQTLEEFIIESNYGELWRKSVEAGRAAKVQLSFNDLNNPKALEKIFDYKCDLSNIKKAIDKCSFKSMAKVESDKGFYYLPKGNKNIPYMRKGTSNQWEDLPKDFRTKLCSKNDGELKYLKLSYYDDLKGEYRNYDTR
jgi:hypothetical protein